jgi:hypothetical protein
MAWTAACLPASSTPSSLINWNRGSVSTYVLAHPYPRRLAPPRPLLGSSAWKRRRTTPRPELADSTGFAASQPEGEPPSPRRNLLITGSLRASRARRRTGGATTPTRLPDGWEVGAKPDLASPSGLDYTSPCWAGQSGELPRVEEAGDPDNFETGGLTTTILGSGQCRTRGSRLYGEVPHPFGSAALSFQAGAAPTTGCRISMLQRFASTPALWGRRCSGPC